MKNILKKWLSAYNLRYPRSIVYMLQASEYKILAYLKWWHRAGDFHNVEIRKKFVKTSKSFLLLLCAWLIFLFSLWLPLILLFLIISYNFIFYYLPLDFVVINSLFYLSIIFLSPYILAFGILVPLFLIKVFIQNPIEYFIIKSAKKKLKKHKGLKIGIAGSFGKTTMREILKTVLAEGKKVAAPPENHNTLLGISNFIKTLQGDEEVLIFEFGEYYKGDIKEMCEFVKPDMGVITGVNEAHLEKFKNLDTTANTIFELADWLLDKPLYINGENELAKKYALKFGSDTFSAMAESVSSGFIFYERKGVNGIKVLKAETDLNGLRFSIGYLGKSYEFFSKLLGLHQIGPLVGAIHIAINLGMNMEDIQRGVANTEPFNHRLEPKALNGGVIMLDDSYNGNPDGARAVIDFLASLADHPPSQGFGRTSRRFYVTPGLVEMGPKTEAVHNDLGKYLAKSGIEKIILIKNSVTPYIERGLKEGGYGGEIIWFEDSPKMLSALPHLTVEGDVVLLQNDWPDQYY